MLTQERPRGDAAGSLLPAGQGAASEGTDPAALTVDFQSQDREAMSVGLNQSLLYHTRSSKPGQLINTKHLWRKALPGPALDGGANSSLTSAQGCVATCCANTSGSSWCPQLRPVVSACTPSCPLTVKIHPPFKATDNIPRVFPPFELNVICLSFAPVPFWGWLSCSLHCPQIYSRTFVLRPTHSSP